MGEDKAAHGPPRLRLLGTPRLQPAAGAALPLAERDAVLLLLLAAEGPVARPRAAALLWPDSAPRQANISLRQRIFRLKRAWGGDVVVGDAAIRLADGLGHDLDDLDAGLRADPAHAAGELLAGIAPDGDEVAAWLLAARARWQVRLRDALAALAEAHAGAGRIAAALPYAERLVAEAPAAEHAHRRVMRLHYLRGDVAAALAAYRRCCEWLERDQAAGPSAETRALARQIETGANVAPPSGPAAPPPLALLRPPRLVGRDEAVARALQALAEGRAVLVAGEPGVGKSRLLEALAEARPPALRTGARPGDSALPWSLLTRLLLAAPALDALPDWARAELARLVPAWGAGAAWPLQPLRLLQAVAAWLAAPPLPPLVVVDDLQFADAESLDLLLSLAVGGGAVRWLLAVRAAERPPALDAWVGAGGGEAALELVLPGLERAGVHELLATVALPALDAGRLAALLHRHTAGNPLFVLETLRALASAGALQHAGDAAALPVPASLAGQVQDRLLRLGDDARRLASLAAVAGPDFSVALAAVVLGRHALDLAPDWRELQQALFVGAGSELHDAVRDAVLAALPPPIVAELQRQIGRAGAGVGLPAARCALHAAAGGDWSTAADAAERAAAECAAVGRLAEQVAQLDAAAAAAARIGGAGRRAFALQVQASRVGLAVLPLAELQQRAQLLARQAESADEQIEAALAAARCCGHGADYAGLLQTAQQAQALLVEAGDAGPRRIEAECLLAAGLARTGQPEAACARFEAWRDAVDGAALPVQHDFWNMYGYVLEAASRRRESAQALQRALPICVQLGEFGEAMTICANLAGIAAHLGDVAGGIAWAERADGWHRRLGDASSPTAVMARMNLGTLWLRDGRYAAALALFEEASAAFEAMASALWSCVARHHLAQTWLLLGRPAQAHQLLAQAPAPPALRVRRTLLECRLDALSGKPVLARLREAFDALGAAEPRINRIALQLAIAAAEEPAACEALARDVAAEAQRHELVAAALHAHLLQAHALALRGRRAEAAERALALRAQFDAGLRPYDLAWSEALWLLGRAFDAAGRPDDARAAWQQGARWLREHALQQVPEESRDAFVHRQPVNRALLVAAVDGPPVTRR